MGGLAKEEFSELCLSNYARQLLDVNLRPLLADGEGPAAADHLSPGAPGIAEHQSTAAFVW